MTTKQASEYLSCSSKTLYRYVQKGKLHRVRLGRDWDYSKEDLLTIATEVLGKKKQYAKEGEEIVKEDNTLRLVVADNYDMFELDDFGQGELMRVTERLEEMDLMDMTDKGVLYRYAIAVQMQQKYLSLIEEIEVPQYMKLYEVFTKQVVQYERSLGLTPASLQKLNPQKKEVIDEMEGLLDG